MMTRLSPALQILTVPGYTGSGAGHWLTLWELKHPEYRRVEQRDWYHPRKEEWVEQLDRTVGAVLPKVVLIGHSLGCITIAHWAAQSSRPVSGAFLVAPADPERPGAPAEIAGFAPVPLRPLPFPCAVLASSNDPYIELERAQQLANQWQGEFHNLGSCGHLDTAAGFGNWRRGEILFEAFLARLMR